MSVSMHFGDQTQPQAAELTPRTPFRIAILGDFTGRENRQTATNGAIKPIRVDRDNVESLPGKLGAALSLTPLGTSTGKIALTFETLEDFEPDQLFDKVPLFEELRKIRRQLQSNATFAQAAEKVRSWGKLSETTESPAKSGSDTAPQAAAAQPVGNLLDAVLEETHEQSSDWGDMIQSIVGPYIKPGPPPDQKEYLNAVDRVIGDQMRALLHHPAFQQLEANWRSLDRLIRHLETDQRLQVFLLDVAKEELAIDIGPLEKSLRIAADTDSGGEPWAVLAAAYCFGGNAADAQLLGQLGRLASSLAAPLIASATPDLVGAKCLQGTPDPEDDWQTTLDTESAEEWQNVRNHPEARWLGLVFPRYLLRLPYGKSTNPVDTFAFEEMPGQPVHEQYVWGHGAFLVAQALGEAFTADGWDFSPGPVEIGGLPVHLYVDEDGDSAATPTAECLLTERAVERVADAGLTPLISIRNQDAVRIAGLRSLASSNQPLLGKWNT